MPSLITLPIATLAILYAADIGVNRKFSSIKDLLQQVNKNEGLAKTLFVGLKFQVLRSIVTGLSSAISFKCNSCANLSWPNYFFDLTIMFLGMTASQMLGSLSACSIVSVAAGGKAYGLAELIDQPRRYICNEFGLIGFAFMVIKNASIRLMAQGVKC